MSELFDILTDAARIPAWMPHCRAAKCDGPLRKKSRVTLEFGRRSLNVTVLRLGWNPKNSAPGTR